MVKGKVRYCRLCNQSFVNNVTQHFEYRHSDLSREEAARYKFYRPGRGQAVRSNCPFVRTSGVECGRSMKYSSLSNHLRRVHGLESSSDKFRILMRGVKVQKEASSRERLPALLDEYKERLMDGSVGSSVKLTAARAQEYSNIVKRCFARGDEIHCHELLSQLRALQGTSAYKWQAVLCQFLEDFYPTASIVLPAVTAGCVAAVLSAIKRERKKWASERNAATRKRFVKDTTILSENWKEIASFTETDQHRMLEECLTHSVNIARSDYNKCAGAAFCRISSETGSRPGNYRNMLLKELLEATDIGSKRQITVFHEKRKGKVGFVTVSTQQFEWLVKVSLGMCKQRILCNLVQTFFQQLSNVHAQRSATTIAFPCLNGCSPMNVSRVMSNHLKRVTGCGTMTATILRKFIETVHVDSSTSQRRKVAQTVGHSMGIQEKHYALRREATDAFDGSEITRKVMSHLRTTDEGDLWRAAAEATAGTR